MDAVAVNDHHRNALSAIDENSSVNTSGDFGSIYSGTISCKSVAVKSVGSVHSEQTQVIGNGRSRRNHRHSTPSFGESGDKEVSVNNYAMQSYYDISIRMNHLKF